MTYVMRCAISDQIYQGLLDYVTPEAMTYDMRSKLEIHPKRIEKGESDAKMLYSHAVSIIARH